MANSDGVSCKRVAGPAEIMRWEEKCGSCWCKTMSVWAREDGGPCVVVPSGGCKNVAVICWSTEDNPPKKI
jgi:hypothetical protein